MADEDIFGPSPLNTNGLCLLSLDGGGVRGFSSLLILRDLMDQLNSARGTHPPVKPCDVFDLIGGTSTGGLIAIMLGRLELDVDQCLMAYTELMESIFSQKISNVPVDWSGNIISQYDSKKLKTAIETVITRAGCSPTDLMNDGKPRSTKVFVCTTSKDTSQTIRLRSYSVPNEDTISATICEAALATSAATKFFDPVSIGKQQFVDGAFGANNPIEEVEEEAADIWCTKSRDLKPLVKCFVSVGTGSPDRVPISDNIVKFLSKTLVKMATKSEGINRRFMARWSHEVETKHCFRFNVDQGLQNVHMAEFDKQSVIEFATCDYLHQAVQKSQMRDCKKADEDLEFIIRVSHRCPRFAVSIKLTIGQEHHAQLAHFRVMQNMRYTDQVLVNEPSACWTVPFDRNPRYVDCGVVGAVKRRLYGGKSPTRVAFFGLGGAGKTQVALELAYQARELYSDCDIFWIPAIDMESLQQAYQALADQLGIETTDSSEDVRILVKRHLSKPGMRRWLMIVDNADELDMWIGSESSRNGGLEDCLPTSDRGAIVFTTRSTKVAQHIASTDTVKISEMDEQKAREVLRNNLVDKKLLRDTESTRKLLSQLAFLPLAIVQAASFINQNEMELRSYLNLLDGQEQSEIDLLSEDFEDKGRYNSIRNPVAITWLSSFEQIRRQNKDAANYLYFMACIQEKDIPVLLLPPIGVVEQQKAIGVLSSYSFVRTRNESTRLDMHRLVHLATRNWLRSRGSFQEWQSYALHHVERLFPEIDHTHRALWRAAVPHALRIVNLTKDRKPSGTRFELLCKVGSCHIYDGRPKEARRLYREALELVSADLGPDSDRALHALGMLAVTYDHGGSPQKAIKIWEQVLEKRIRINGSDSYEANSVLLQLASAHRTAVDGPKAKECYNIAIPYFVRNFSPGSPQVMDVLERLATFYASEGCISDGEELSLQLLEISRNVRGSDDPATATLMLSLGMVYMDQWRLDEADKLITEGLEVTKRTLGLEHLQTIRMMGWLACLREYQGRHEEALVLGRECLRFHRENFGADHESVRVHTSHLDNCTTPT
ncbi:unnamed protein product [Penicillium olsonii]|uniref:PNPLA domain-containing protein n=1 Tax=Penicillium olsonii TaxID=99116 RepID=A0A9W4IC08_PENOL|nr:unnamed protein product [Penicillium olsonii]CAG8256574.1 unnamed protein product [Penicillium olsonii]